MNKRKCPKVTVGSRWWNFPTQTMYVVTHVNGLEVWIKPADVDVTLAGRMHNANMRNAKLFLTEAEYLALKTAEVPPVSG